MAKLSVLILAKNEEKNIADCIRSVSFADEVVVLDDFSTDRTAAIAEGLGARVVQRALDGNWGAQQTFGIGQTRYEWLFMIDADERASKRLAAKVSEIVAEDDRRYAYLNARLNYFWEHPLRHGGWFPDYVVRLLPREGTHVEGLVHQAIRHTYEEVRLPKDCYMIHYPYRSWEHYFSKFNVYTTLAAEKLREKGKRASLFDILLHPAWASFRMYVLRGGWRDGRIGLFLAGFHFFYTMAKYVKLYYLDKKNEHVGDESW